MATEDGPVRLTERQHDVMIRVAQGLTYRSIASELGISLSAVKQNIRAIKDAYGIEILAALTEAYRADYPDTPPGPRRIDRLVPAPLDGPRALLWRLVAIFGAAFVVLAVAIASVFLLEALKAAADGRATVSPPAHLRED
ncbi:MAG: sigma factor-like helix-turn-helix DNA-binding protein [Pseudomonadota bacterium]